MLLHGFTQAGASWAGVIAALGERYTALAPDLRGHGAAAAARPVSFEAVVADIAALAPERFALAGYSMGGRIALRVALAHPARVTRLALIGASAGLEQAAERAARRARDEEWASLLERDGIVAFADAWERQELFAGQPPAVAAAARALRLAQDPAGLAAALRGIGTGAMDPLWSRLGELSMPATVIAGERDARFRVLGERLATGLAQGRLALVAGAGHAAQLEQPEAVAALL